MAKRPNDPIGLYFQLEEELGLGSLPTDEAAVATSELEKYETMRRLAWEGGQRLVWEYFFYAGLDQPSAQPAHALSPRVHPQTMHEKPPVGINRTPGEFARHVLKEGQRPALLVTEQEKAKALTKSLLQPLALGSTPRGSLRP